MRTLRNLLWILPASLGLGLVLASLDGGGVWPGMLAYATVLVAGWLALAALWQSVSGGRTLVLILVLALFLRLGLGVAFSFLLPPFGNDNEMQNAGYIFRDSYQRDNQAWELAASDTTLWKAFDKSFSTDQYGGLLFVSGVIYRYLSPEFHRPWLVILLAALTAAAGIGLAFKAARAAWGESMALPLAWMLAIYPESILLGSAQMREPFLMTFIAMGFWGVVIWKEHRWRSIVWIGAGLTGTLLFSPGVAAVAIIMLAGWWYLSSRERRIRWWAVVGVLLLVTASVVLLAGAVAGSLQVPYKPLATLLNWLRYTSSWDTYLTQRASDGLQPLFDALPKALHIPLATAYGIGMPLLPAAIIAPGVWPMRLLGTLRALGWYSLLPFLLYCLRPIFKTVEKRQRLAWLWLWACSWAWILLSSFRAGGDQWDNPRYRAILILFQSALAIYGLLWAVRTRDRWLGRILLIEGVVLVALGYWYLTRYSGWMPGQVSIISILIFSLSMSVLILAAGWLLDYRRGRARR